MLSGDNKLNDDALTIREILSEEHEKLGLIMIDAYSNLDGFPAPAEMPDYYKMLANIGSFNSQPKTKVLVAISSEEALVGGVVYFADMNQYGVEGATSRIENASGIRLLGVAPSMGGRGIGRALTRACIQLAQDKKHAQVVLHTTAAMRIAWALYEKLGFVRVPSLDVEQYGAKIRGFILQLDEFEATAMGDL
jgi:ribosomal protein S18 acetylase RimI-like enzyme